MHDVNNKGNSVSDGKLHYLLNFFLSLKLFYKIKSINKRRQKNQIISSKVIFTPCFSYESNSC